MTEATDIRFSKLKRITQNESQIAGPSDYYSTYHAYDSGLSPLENNFSALFQDKTLPFRNFTDYVRWFTTKYRRNPTGLEIAGQGRIFNDLNIDRVASCLAIPSYLVDPYSTDIKKRANSQRNITFVEGDIVSPATWESITARFRQENLIPPSLILFTPAGAIDPYIPSTISFYKYLINKVLTFAPKQGLLFIGEFPKMVATDLKAYLNTPDVLLGYNVQVIENTDGGIFRISQK